MRPPSVLTGVYPPGNSQYLTSVLFHNYDQHTQDDVFQLDKTFLKCLAAGLQPPVTIWDSL